ncbi:hypothetical protein [Thermococcus sp.]|uniref:hypothetical protein n=1 Tax=Thermococcus sp. TaxID=35749 RepID=UPI00262769DC|nr:hypothetical protein [Thermococcus sp.]
MKWKSWFAVLLGLLVVGVTAGGTGATVWGMSAGYETGATSAGIDPHIQVSGSYGGVSVSFSVSWNDNNGAAWGVYQYGNYDDTIHKFILFTHGNRHAVRDYSTPIIPITHITYSILISMGYTSTSRASYGYNVITPYTVVVTKTVSHPFTGSTTKTIVNEHASLQGYVPDISRIQSINPINTDER